MPPIPPDASAALTASILTLMGLAALMAFIPRCSHPECKAAHDAATEKERKAATAAEVERVHAYHDRLRPQLACSLCQLTPCPVCAGRGGCNPECDCRKCVA